MASISNFLFSLPTSLFSQQQQQQQQQTSDDTVHSDENNLDSISSSSSPTLMDESNQPITGICLVSKPGSVPTGYTCIRKAYDDRNKDADVMPDSFFDRKERFICITRIYPLAGDKAFILEDIKLINERDSPPSSYIALTQTVDGQEKATAKRTICVKLVERQPGIKCICDVIFLSRSKRPPQSYTIIGEINSLHMCIKEGVVPSFRAPPPVPGYSKSSSNLYPDPHNPSFYYGSQQSYGSNDYSHTNTLTKKSEEKELLDGIPFQINPKYLATNRYNRNSYSDIDSVQIFTPYEIDQHFFYDFHLERSSLD